MATIAVINTGRIIIIPSGQKNFKTDKYRPSCISSAVHGIEFYRVGKVEFSNKEAS